MSFKEAKEKVMELMRKKIDFDPLQIESVERQYN
jgi:hypothetical protein